MARPALVAALCAVVIASVAEASPLRTCPTTCVCRHTPTVNKADCRDFPEWDLKASDAQVVRIMPPPQPVPASPLILSRLDLFPKVQMLSVTNRSIVELTSGNLPTLQVLDLSNNKISRFNDRTFHHMPVLRQLNLAGNPLSLKRGLPLLKSSSIRTLDLGYSGLTHIPDGSLSGIPNLTSLYLQGNPLKLQESYSLVDRISIQELDLSYCKLTKIPNNSLNNLVNLRRLYLKGNNLKTILGGVLPVTVHYLDLSANRIRDVPLSTLSALKNLTNLELAKNPVKCTCELITFLDRMSEQNVVSEKMIVCAEPAKYSNVPWKDIDERELCKDDVTSDESTDSSLDDDSSSTSESLEKDDISYETDGPTDEENRIMSQHPPPLSLQKLLQKPTRYQNMEENSIQSDQPYSNTSDEGTDHMNDSPATTLETVPQSDEDTYDDLIVSSGAEPDYDSGKHVTTSTEKSSQEQRDVRYPELLKVTEDSDSLVVSELPDSGDVVGAVGTSTETQDKWDDTDKEERNGVEKMTIPVRSSSENAASWVDQDTSRDRENLENEKEQEVDLLKATDASLAVEDRTETPPESLKAAQESTENPDSETFLRNEETIAMGKMMPESKRDLDKDEQMSKTSETDEKVKHPFTLATRSDGEIEEETSTKIIGDLSHYESILSTDEVPVSPQSGGNGHGETSFGSAADEVAKSRERADIHIKDTEETLKDHHKLVTFRDTNPGENLYDSVHQTAEETHDETTIKQSPSKTLDTEKKHSSESGPYVSEKIKTNSEDSETSHEGVEQPTINSVPSDSAEGFKNGLKNGELASTEVLQPASEGMGVGFEATETHSDNETEHAEAKTKSPNSDLDTQGHLNKNVTPEIRGSYNEDTTDHAVTSTEEHKLVETDAMTESVLATTDALATNDPSLTPDKDIPAAVSSRSSNLSEDIGAQLTSISATLPSLTEHRVTPDETTTLKSATTTYRDAETKIESPGSVFPLYLIPGLSGNKDQNTVSESTRISPDHSRKPAVFSDDHVSEPADSTNDHILEPAHVPSELNYDDTAVENNLARMSDSEDVVMTEDREVHFATVAYVVIASMIVCVIVAVGCVSLRTRPEKKRKGSAPVRIRGENVSPGTEMKDMMNPLLEPIAEGQTGNEFHDDPTPRPSFVSLELNGQSDKFPVVSPTTKENGLAGKGSTSKDGLTQDLAYKPIPKDDDNTVTEVVIETTASSGGVNSTSQNGLPSAAPVNGKIPRQNGTATNKVKVIAGIIPPAVPRTPVYVEKVASES